MLDLCYQLISSEEVYLYQIPPKIQSFMHLVVLHWEGEIVFILFGIYYKYVSVWGYLLLLSLWTTPKYIKCVHKYLYTFTYVQYKQKYTKNFPHTLGMQLLNTGLVTEKKILEPIIIFSVVTYDNCQVRNLMSSFLFCKVFRTK